MTTPVTPTFQQEFSSFWGYTLWLLTHRKHRLSLVWQEVDPLCSQCPHCLFFALNKHTPFWNALSGNSQSNPRLDCQGKLHTGLSCNLTLSSPLRHTCLPASPRPALSSTADHAQQPCSSTKGEKARDKQAVSTWTPAPSLLSFVLEARPTQLTPALKAPLCLGKGDRITAGATTVNMRPWDSH